jgi:hypothetical protein
MHAQTISRSRDIEHSLDRALIFSLALAVLCLLAAQARGDESCTSCPQPRAQDELWLVSNRSLNCDVEAQAAHLKYWRYDREVSWVRADLAELLATDSPQAVTTVFVHGNRIPACEAFTKGWTAYRTLVRCADERPVRFIIWSWPSDKVGGLVQDAREKACRTNPSGYCLAWFLDQLDPAVPVSLWAHSLGARIVTGALHLLGGGQFDGYRLSQRAHKAREPMQVALLVAALDNDWLLPGRFHGQAMSQTSGMLLVNNCCDRLLKRYHLIYGHHCPQQALGYAGIGSWGVAAADWTKVSQLNACPTVGSRHVLADYLASPDLVARMRSTLLFESNSSASESPAAFTASGEDRARSPAN